MLSLENVDGTVGAGQSYWHRDGGAPANDRERCASNIPARTDILIVGAGLAGLATALRIKEQRASAGVTIVEARYPGYGASGRNGGLMSPLAAPVWLLTAGRNRDHAWGLATINAKTADAARWAAAMAPDAEVSPTELVLEAKGFLTDAGLREVASNIDATGIAYALAPGSGGSRAAEMRIAAHTVHPYRLVRGLEAAARARGIEILCGKRVEGIDERGANAACVRLSDGCRIEARTVVVATNAYTPSLKLARPPSAKAVFNYMLATGPLDDNAIGRLAGSRDFTVELNHAYAFWRLHGRSIVYGGLERLKAVPDDRDLLVPKKIGAALTRHLRTSLGDAMTAPSITDVWGGKYHVTPTNLPVVRRSAPDSPVVLNVGYGGEGVALTMALAPLAAAIALGEAPRDADLSRLDGIMRNTHVPVTAMGGFALAVARRLIAGVLPARG